MAYVRNILTYNGSFKDRIPCTATAILADGKRPARNNRYYATALKHAGSLLYALSALTCLHAGG